ncbi:hypothetical protein HanXRQr2_Chr01g0033801 [Helianthus annuus]|uniref:Uncharacterized protein n=1 Tax=Helianthus annuus TaxID=4232 RepID=A0A9K3JWK9_HELAN|nr:hypothetical protein HanXRQr2_Chr01g0033801 [Helianthus annuus]
MGYGGTLNWSELATTTSDRLNLHPKALESTTSVLFVGDEDASKAGCWGLTGSRISVSLSLSLSVTAQVAVLFSFFVSVFCC